MTVAVRHLHDARLVNVGGNVNCAGSVGGGTGPARSRHVPIRGSIDALDNLRVGAPKLNSLVADGRLNADFSGADESRIATADDNS